MSGQHFLSTLKNLGYPGADQLDAQTFDWMFENEAVAPFLDWFSAEVQPANLLDPKQKQEYDELAASVEGVLEGEQLEDALGNLSIIDDDDSTSEEKIRADIAALEDELRASELRKQVLIQQRNALTIQQTRLTDRLARMDTVDNTAKVQYKLALEHSHADNTKMNRSLHQLLTSVSDLTGLYSLTDSLPPSCVFLSQLSLDDYHNAEEKFTSQLTAFTKKQFFEGLSEMAGESSRYNFLEISDPDSLLVRGQDEQVNLDDCKELHRLHAFYPKSESLRISGEVEEKSMAAACQFAERKIQQFKQTPYPMRMAEIRPKLQDSESVLAVLRRDVASLSQQQVPGLIKESATAQVTKILRGDYNLKIARQDYFTANQDQVINQLVLQRSRNEFLTMAYELEARNHRDTHRLLTAVTMLLREAYSQLQERQSMLCDPALSASKHQRSTVDSRDKFLHSLAHMLNTDSAEESNKAMFLTYESLCDDSSRIHHRMAALRAEMSSANTNRDNNIQQLEQSLQRCEGLVYSGSSTLGGQPQLSPQAIVDALQQLDSLLKRLEQAVMDIMKDVNAKKKSLRADSLAQMERELFVYFYNSPDRLRRCVDDVNARLQAQMVQ